MNHEVLALSVQQIPPSRHDLVFDSYIRDDEPTPIQNQPADENVPKSPRDQNVIDEIRNSKTILQNLPYIEYSNQGRENLISLHFLNEII